MAAITGPGLCGSVTREVNTRGIDWDVLWRGCRDDDQPARTGGRRPVRGGARLRRAPPAHHRPDLARRRTDRGEFHRRFRRHAAAPAAERAADAACQGRVRRARRHLASDRAVRRARHQGDDLHAWPDLRALSAGAARGGTQRTRDRRPHVGAPRAEGSGDGARPSAEDRERAGGDRRTPAGRQPQRAHAWAAEAGGVPVHLARSRPIIGRTICAMPMAATRC